MNLNVLLTLWSGLLLATVAVSVLRWNAGQKEDDHLHMLDDAKLISAQIATAHRLDVLDRWKAVLLVLTLLLGPRLWSAAPVQRLAAGHIHESVRGRGANDPQGGSKCSNSRRFCFLSISPTGAEALPITWKRSRASSDRK
jgi:hypothetical protein